MRPDAACLSFDATRRAVRLDITLSRGIVRGRKTCPIEIQPRVFDPAVPAAEQGKFKYGRTLVIRILRLVDENREFLLVVLLAVCEF